MSQKNYNSNHISLSITIIGTLLGVLFALYANDIYQYFSNRSRLSNLYLVAEKELEDKTLELKQLIQFASSRNGLPIEEIDLPKTINNIYNDVTFHQFFSPTMRNHMYGGSYISSFKSILLVVEMSRKDKKIDEFIKFTSIIHSQLDLHRRFIIVERQYLLGLISASQISKLWLKFQYEAKQQQKLMQEQKWKYIQKGNSINFILDEDKEST